MGFHADLTWPNLLDLAKSSIERGTHFTRIAKSQNSHVYTHIILQLGSLCLCEFDLIDARSNALEGHLDNIAILEP